MIIKSEMRRLLNELLLWELFKNTGLLPHSCPSLSMSWSTWRRRVSENCFFVSRGVILRSILRDIRI